MMRNPLIIYTVALSALGFIGGCASTQYDWRGEGERRIANGDWIKAYESIEIALGSDDSRTRLWGYDLLVANPSIKIAATNSFSEGAVGRVFSLYDPITANDIETYRLSLYSKYASDDEIKFAAANIKRAFDQANAPRLAVLEARRTAGNSLIVTDGVLEQLSPDDQAQLKTRYTQMRHIPENSVGKIISSQVLDKSRPGSNFGSQLGAAFGQAAYIDHTISGRGYSAVGQLGAGFIGAVIGSSLNRSPQQRFLVNYGVQLSDGSVKGVVSESSDGVTAPVGQCVFVIDAQAAPAYLCSDTLVGFLERAGKLANNGGEVTRRVQKGSVRCKLSAIATLALTSEECKRLNGEEIN